MIADRLAKLESTLRDNTSIPEGTRQELLGLLTGLKTEVAPLLDAQARDIAGSAEAAVAASIKRDEQPEQAAQAVEGLAASVREFEATHPRLVEIVDQL